MALKGTSGETVRYRFTRTASAEGVTTLTTAENTDTRAVLSLAASLLDSVGADMWTPCEVVVPCLAAAELLECAGGRASRIALVGGGAGPSIRAALAALARLDQDPTGYVLEAGAFQRAPWRW